MEESILLNIFYNTLKQVNLLLTVEIFIISAISYYTLLGFLSSHFPKAKVFSKLFPYFSKKKIVLPKKVFLIRHGQSLGNVSETAYETTPDWSIPLTKTGKQEAMNAGLKIKEMCGQDPVIVYFSPYKRTKETMKQIIRAFPRDQVYLLQQEPRIREQDFGNFQDNKRMKLCKRERLQFSRFFYRFPSGESGADVYDRVSSFMESLFRLFHRESDKDYNLVIVSHGLTIRVILMRWFRWTVQEFETLVNPKNAKPVVMERKLINGQLKYRLTPDSWKMLHAYEKLSERALSLRANRNRRRASRTLITLNELMESDNEEKEAEDVEEKEFTKPLQTIRESSSLENSENEKSPSESEYQDTIPRVFTNEDIAECLESNSMAFTNLTKRAKIVQKLSEREGYQEEFEKGETEKFSGEHF